MQKRRALFEKEGEGFVISRVKCTKRVSLGLFAIDEGTSWNVEGVRYDGDPKRSMVHLCEADPGRAWAEVPQDILAECFAIG